MISRDELSGLPKKEYEELRAKRIDLLNMYCGKEGAEVLLGIARSAKVFDVLDPKDEAQIGARNFVVCMLQELGLFDEEYLLDCIRGLQRRDVLPKRRADGDREEANFEEGGF